MPLLPGVTRASATDEPRRHRASRRRPCAVVILIAIAVSGPLSAQTRPPDEAIEAPRQQPIPVAAPSAASLERIRRALALRRPTELPGLDRLDIVDDGWLVDRRPAIQLFHGLYVVGGIDLFGVIDATTGPVPMAGPTHRAMMSVTTPRAFNEARATDVLGIASASAFALVPYAATAIRKIAGWLFGDDGDDRTAHPILTESEDTRARAGVTADNRVLGARIQQRGRTVALSLVVRADTPPDTARALGARFVRLVKMFASAEPDPEHDVGAGDYDYIVRVNSPTASVIALGGKATSDTTINWETYPGPTMLTDGG